ncbi:neuronal PAS domain-containing protein 4-like protein, partial [Lates japonicus]
MAPDQPKEHPKPDVTTLTVDQGIRLCCPSPRSDQERPLSYLHSTCTVTVKQNGTTLCSTDSQLGEITLFSATRPFFKLLHGFILVTTTHGRLVYVLSQNVAGVSGLSMCRQTGLPGRDVLRLQSRICHAPDSTFELTRTLEHQGISCANYIISSTGASPQTHNNTKCFKGRRTSDSQSEEPVARARRDRARQILVWLQGPKAYCSPVPL